MQATVAEGTGETAASAHRTSWLLRHAAVCIALTALAFQQSPGLTVADTKVDLFVNPTGWLGRSLHLWDTAGTFGQLQNQAYGYLWPMGPFFAVGSWLGMPAWVIQRLWWALLLWVAYTGVVRLSGRLNIGTPTARLVAGIAFALSPRILTQLGWSSVEAWPSAVAPWVLIPLIGLAKGAPLRRAIAGSALAVACAGGVNATAVFAVVPLALLWLATLRPVRRRLVAIAAWCGAVACATAWWLVPLLVLGRYSPPFLDYIETAHFTTSVTDFVTALRGASYWVAYLGGPYGPTLPVGAQLASDRALIVATIAVAGLGLLGLSRRGMPQRRFLVSGLVLGAALVGLGHVGDLAGTFGGVQQDFLDGIGAPLRNAHKFDVVLRLPLALGLAHLLGIVGRAAVTARHEDRRSARTRAWLVTGLTVAAVAGVASPALAGHLAPPGGVKEVPGYWRDAADWLDGHLGRDRVLVVPAARFPSYDWGNTTDEITQPLLQGRWAVRNAIPLTPPTTIRLLDAVESELSTGAGSTGLADLLARSGVRYVLFRGDLDYGRSDTTPPLVVHQALSRSPGLSRVASFGPIRGGERTPGVYQDHGLDVPMRALEVFKVERNVEPVVAFDAKDVPTVVGGPESLLDIASAGQLTGAPTVLAGDLPGDTVSGPVIMTDGLRRRDVSFGRLRDASATLTADEPFDQPAPAHDYLPTWGKDRATTVRYSGISDVRASSSRAQIGLPGGSRPEHQPFAALDGDIATSWQSAPGSGAGQWLEIALERPRAVSEVRLRFDLEAAAVPTKVTVRAGAESATVESFGSTMVIKLPGVHATRTVEVIVDAVLALRPGPSNVGISEIEIPGLRPARSLAIAPAPARGTGPPTIVLSAAPSTPGCFFLQDRPRCSPEVARVSEDGNRIDRRLTVSAGGQYLASVWARPRPGAALNAVVDQQVATENPLGLAPAVSASSTTVADPAGRPGAVVDGDPATAWSPAATDKDPMLRMAWLKPRVVTGIRLALASEVAASRPGGVRVIGDDGMRGGFLDKNGVLIFDRPMRTDEITVFFLDPPSRYSRSPYRNALEPLPVAVGEVTALPDAPGGEVDLDSRVALPCGSGPSLKVGASQLETKISGTLRDLVEMREVAAEPCGKTSGRLTLTTGEQRVIASASTVASPTRLSLAPESPQQSPAPTAVRIDTWSSAERRVHVDEHDSDRIIAVRENTNPGWQARIAGVELTPVVVDGWQQGWLLPAHTSGEVELIFAPEIPYRAGLLAGVALLVGVVLMALWPIRGGVASAPRPGSVRSDSRPVVPLIVAAAGLILLGGIVGALIVIAGVVLALLGLSRSSWPARTPRHSTVLRVVQWWLPVALVLLAGWLYLDDRQPHLAAGPQLAGLLALGSLWLSTPARRRTVQQQPDRAESLDRGDGVGMTRRPSPPADTGNGASEPLSVGHLEA